ncbi:MAG: hypothetical protein WA435_04945 [Gallionellaceae bacterium]
MKKYRNLVYFVYLLGGLLVFYPSLSSYFFSDDFAFLTIARYIGNPLSFFYYDHFPGGFFYRPLGMLSWWLSYKLVGTHHVLHNLINILIHIGNTCVLFRIFSLVHANFKLNALLALLFLVHPLTISTTMWLSDRFDLLATLFIFSSLYSFFRYRVDGSRHAYFLSIAACMLAVLCKELAYFTPLAITVVAIHFNQDPVRTMRQKLLEVAPFYAVILLVFGGRFILLRNTAIAHFLGENSLSKVMAGGVWNWLRLLPNYYSFNADWAHWNIGAWTLIVVTLVVLIGLTLHALFKPGAVSWSMIALGLTIMLAPAILQAPVSFSNLSYNPSGSFDFTNMVDSRFYYLSFAGFLLAAQQPLSVACKIFASSNANANALATYAIYILLAVQSIFFGILSYSLGNGWSKLSNGQPRHVAEQTSLAVEQLSLPQSGCKLYILDIPSDALYFREYSDSVIKALVSQGSPAIHCLVLTEKAPWYQIMLREDLATMQAVPLRPIIVGGQARLPTLIGDLAYVYLNVPDDIAVARDPNAVFIEFDGQKYIDVTQQVHSGSKKVNFFSDRP